MPIHAKNASEPIPGYRIRKRIGAGGYGEVWSTDAPGGLKKAIKFVYGYLDDERANRELKSLNRVRGVRHPFLLSLERIEVVDGQLLIVTELADTSLKSRFDECRKDGMQGIPRDELLGYLKDTADALDYMSEKHTLQHLDVKPENLLLLSGRIKVADFGLVKDIGDQSISMMGGLTPLYASPEVYDGMPSRFSDQYSLAIVFQEMLTGQMPFDGKTAAQLAMQHAAEDPDLTPLPPRDRAILRKALSKSPVARFSSCVEMINHLVTGESLDEESAAMSPSIVVGRAEEAPSVGVSAGLPHLQPEKLLSATELPELGLRCRPTLFLGVGGIGGKICSKIKGRMAQRFNGEISPFQVLAIDTDAKALNSLQSDIAGTLLSQREVFAAPLRKPEDYRSQSDALLKWLSRRWLYNIPRSQLCEGRRPLGRLAMVDHASKIFEAIHAAVTRAQDAEGIAAASRAGGVRFDGGVSIVLIGCVSGATGSGMLLDLAYACRQILAGMGVKEVNICGMLPHAVGGDQTIRQLAAVNAFAFSEEWRHYAQYGYPGDVGCGLKPVRSGQPPFDDAYLVPIGERLGEHEFQDALQCLTEYLYLGAVTTGGVFFRHCRDQERSKQQAKNAHVHVRTFGLDRVGMEDDEWVEAGVELLAHDLAKYWQGHDPEQNDTSSQLLRNLSAGSALKKDPIFTDERKASLHELAKQRAAKLALEVNAIKNAASRLVEAELGDGTPAFLRKIINDYSNECGAQGWTPNQFFATIQSAFGEAAVLGGANVADPPPLEAQLTNRMRSLAEACGRKAGVWLRRVVEHQDARVSGARYLTLVLQKHLQGMEEQCAGHIRHGQEELLQQEQMLKRVEPSDGKAPPVPHIPTESELLNYAQMRLDIMIYRCVARFTQLLVPYMEEADADLRDLGKAWELAKQKLELGNERVRAGSDAARSALTFLRDAGIERLVNESRRELTELSQRNRIFDAMEAVAPDTNVAVASLRRAAKRALMVEFQQSDVSCFPESGAPPRAVRLSQALAAATPNLRGCGGVQRLLVMIPEASSEQTAKSFFSEQADQSPTVLQSNDDDVIICYEVGQVSLSDAAMVMVGGRQDFIDCASRVRTRTDIEWSGLRDTTS